MTNYIIKPGDALYDYKQDHDDPKFDFEKLDWEILKYGRIIPCGTVLYHGGDLFNTDTLKKALSTSRDKRLAINNFLFYTNSPGAYAKGECSVFKLYVSTPIKAYEYDNSRSYGDSGIAGEQEILFPSGISLYKTMQRGYQQANKEEAWEKIYNIDELGYITTGNKKSVPVVIYERLLS